MRTLFNTDIYRDSSKYAAFTCIEKCDDGSYLTAFRLAPREAEIHHVHSQSRAVVMRSENGLVWEGEPIPLFPDCDMAQQDPHITKLHSGRLLATAFTWQAHPMSEKGTLTDVFMETMEDKGVLWRCAGVVTSISTDNGRSWRYMGKITLPNAPREMWACAACHSKATVLDDGTVLLPLRVESASGYYTYIIRSSDGGESWEYLSHVITDDSAEHHHYYDEAYIERLTDGRLVIMFRCYDEGGLMEYSFSDDDGLNWTKPVRSALWGFPQTSRVLKDGRVLVVYGYRRDPFGVRCRLVKGDFSDIDTAEETVILSYPTKSGRLHNISSPADLGYPSAVELNDGTALVTYYCYDTNDGTSMIRGTILEV